MHFLTFANTAYPTGFSRIVKQAKDFGIFETIKGATEHDIPEFIEKHRDFINNNPKGYGLFIWQPKIILDALEKLNDNEILFYCNSTTHLNKKGLEKFRKYTSYLEKKDVVVFCVNDNYKPNMYVKQDAILQCFPEFNRIGHNHHYIYTGSILMKKNKRSISFIKEWLELCENYHFLDTSRSCVQEAPWFHGQDSDNGLYGLAYVKHKVLHDIFYDIYPDEINVYNSYGHQMEHVCHSTGTPKSAIDWSELNEYPIQYRRDRVN